MAVLDLGEGISLLVDLTFCFFPILSVAFI